MIYENRQKTKGKLIDENKNMKEYKIKKTIKFPRGKRKIKTRKDRKEVVLFS